MSTPTTPSGVPKGWLDIIQFYSQRRLLTIFLFGIASGFPWVMIGSALSAWLNELGFTRSMIGYFGAVFAVYSVNFLWSPIVDRVRAPFLSAWLGHRRGWILLCQLGIIGTCIAIASVNFQTHLTLAALLALGIAIFSATQDIGIDAYRIDSVGEDEGNVQSAGAAMATAGWWTGFAGLGAIPFFLSDLPNWDWSHVYYVLAGIMVLLSAGVWIAREPKTQRGLKQQEAELHYQQIAAREPGKTLAMTGFAFALLGGLIFAISGQVTALSSWVSDLTGVLIPRTLWVLWFIIMLAFLTGLVMALVHLQRQAERAGVADLLPVHRRHRIAAWIVVTMIEPLAEFFRRSGPRFALSVLLFVLLFKIGEAFLGRMSIVFYQEIGFTNTEIGMYSKLVNWWVTIAFALIGSYVNMRFGILKGLFIGGSAMALSNLLFSALALTGPHKGLFLAAVISDGFTSAWSTVAFVALISLLCNRAFTATQYALMASVGTLGRTVLASYSGAVVDWLDGNWAVFFFLTTVMVIPSLLFLWSIRKPIQRLEDESRAQQR
ncbi:AmpG family muropeptide MFS transporter [Aliidiomarina sanyensis]|uniref:MFS transporter permease n=1 Tax=Aliidiomarina sanyensis TaxID=1249555 RepID=A0A432WNK3_9GAMM|nr:MFS transporter permease [Aliidiomarina sanyensis]